MPYRGALGSSSELFVFGEGQHHALCGCCGGAPGQHDEHCRIHVKLRYYDYWYRGCEDVQAGKTEADLIGMDFHEAYAYLVGCLFALTRTGAKQLAA